MIDKKDIGKFVICTTRNQSFLMSGNKIKIFDSIEDAELSVAVYDLDNSIILKVEKVLI